MREFCGNLREFCGNLRAFCGQNGYGFSAPHNFRMPLHVLTNLRASFSRLPLQTFVYSVKGREHWNSLFLGVLGVSGFCGKKCYDFPNIQSKAETTFFFRRTKVQDTKKNRKKGTTSGASSLQTQARHELFQQEVSNSCVLLCE